MSSEEEETYSRRDLEEEEEAVVKDEEDECAPPRQDEKEMLFLIEFLVDTMLVKPEHMDLGDVDPCLLQGQACILLNFIHFPPMSICEKDVDKCRQTGDNYIKFNSGKSLMFALSETQFNNPPPIYLEINAFRMLPHGSVPNKLQIGMTKICLIELFRQVFEKVNEHPEKLPLSKSIKDKYQLVGTKNKCPTAEVTIYIRLSCLGQNIVTEFQRGGDECEPFLFKSKESKKVYECKPKDIEEENEDLCPPLPGWGLSTGKDCGDKRPVSNVGCCRGGGGGGGGGGSAGGGGGGWCQTSGDNSPTGGLMNDDEYEEFGAEVHGHALTIKVQKSQKTWDDPSSAKAKEGVANVTFQVPQNASICNKGKGGNKASVYNVTSGNAGKCGGQEPLRIVQGIDSPDKDVFLLRIGKKGEDYSKGKLELELRTPKPKVERPVTKPRKWDKAIQTEKEEQPKKGKKNKK